jgi:hypothetical protein
MSEKLVMTAPVSEGAFVKELQGEIGIGFQEGFHVHKDWFAKTISFDDAIELAYNAAREREDVMVAVKDLDAGLSKEEMFVFVVGERQFVPTDHALEQFAIKAEVPSSTIMRELRSMEGSDAEDHSVMVKLAKNALRKMPPEKVFRLRTYTDGTCRAVLSERYAPVDNRWYLEVLKELLPSARLSHWRGDEDSLYGNLILPDSMIDYGPDDSDYGGMVSVGNCEIGTRTVSQRPSLFRSICMNGCIWGQVEGKRIKRRHIGTINLESLKIEIAKNVADQMPLIESGLHKFLELRQREVASGVNMRAIVGVICKEFKLGKTEANRIFDHWEKHESEAKSLFGVLNGITRAGQTFDNPTWVKFDELGGQLVDMKADKWEAINRRAASYTEDDYKDAFGSAVLV